MATVTLRTVWFNLASDPTQALSIEVVTQIDPTPQTPGEIRMYGQGRYRSVTSGATQKQTQLSFQDCDPATVAQIRAWDGVTLIYRDDSGERYFGCYRSPQISRHPGDSNADVTLTFSELTVDESV